MGHHLNSANGSALSADRQNISRIKDSLTVEQADAANSHQVIITLSDSRVLLLDLDQILGLHLQELPEIAEDEDSEWDSTGFVA